MQREDLIRRIKDGYAAYSSDDFEGATELFDEDFVLVRPGGLGRIEGLKALREFYEPDAFVEMTFEIRSIELNDSADVALVESLVSGVGSKSGIPVRQEGFQVWSVRGDRFVRCLSFIDEDEAREAAGLERPA